jgi:hypothetical protein
MGNHYMEEKVTSYRQAELLAEASKDAQIRQLKQSLRENTGQRQTNLGKRKLKIGLQAYFRKCYLR